MIDNPQIWSADQRARLLEERFHIGTWSWRAAGEDLDWSAGMFRVLGLDPNAVQPSFALYASLVHPDDRAQFASPETLAADGRLRDARFRIIRPDGSLRWVHSLAEPLFDRTGEVSHVNATVHDITDVEQLRGDARAFRQWTAGIASLLRINIWKADAAGNLLDVYDWRRAAAHLREPDRGAGWMHRIGAPDRPRLKRMWDHAVRTRSTYRASYDVEGGPDGATRLHILGGPLQQAATPGEDVWIGVVRHDDGVIVIGDSAQTIEPAELSPAQIRAARAFVGWSADELAARARVSTSTVRRLENGRLRGMRADSLGAVRAAFEAAGLRFTADPDGRRGLVGG